MRERITVVEKGIGDSANFDKDHELLGGISIIFAKKHGSARIDAIIDGTIIDGEKKKVHRSPLLHTNHKRKDLQEFMNWLLYHLPYILTDDEENEIDYVVYDDYGQDDAHV